MKPTKEIYLEAIAKIEKFSPAPRVLGKAMSLLRNADTDISEISDLIKTDLALTTDIIRGANSAFYGFGARVASLDQAIQKIGFRESVRLLNLSVAHTLAKNELSCYGIASEDYWTESLFNGLFMEILARHTNAIDPDLAHTAGLLRYIGRLAINRSLIDLGSGLFWDGASPLMAWELSQIGFTQAQAAGHLLRTWGFTDDIILAIEWQEQPEQAPSSSDLLGAMHFTACVLPQAMGLTFASIPGQNTSIDAIESEFMARFKITPETTIELVDTTRHAFTAINAKLYGNHPNK